MDREIPKEVRNKERNKKIIRYGAIGVAGIVVVSVLISLMRTGVKEKDLVFSQVGKGTIEVSVSGLRQGSPGIRGNYQLAHQYPHFGSVQKRWRQRGCRYPHPETGLAECRDRLQKDAG